MWYLLFMEVSYIWDVSWLWNIILGAFALVCFLLFWFWFCFSFFLIKTVCFPLLPNSVLTFMWSLCSSSFKFYFQRITYVVVDLLCLWEEARSFATILNYMLFSSFLYLWKRCSVLVGKFTFKSLHLKSNFSLLVLYASEIKYLNSQQSPTYFLNFPVIGFSRQLRLLSIYYALSTFCVIGFLHFLFVVQDLLCRSKASVFVQSEVQR